MTESERCEHMEKWIGGNLNTLNFDSFSSRLCVCDVVFVSFLGVYFKSINFSCDIFIIALDQCLDKEAGDGLVNYLHLGSKPGNMKKLLRKNMKYVFFCQLKASICNLSSLITY